MLTEVRRDPAEQALHLAWSDGHRALFPYDYVRGWCPCALCQGHHALQILYHPPAGAVEPVAIHPVGNYGISILWSDRHSTGIYRFTFLRDICPCPDCRDGGAPAPQQG
jgi:DUF971 family protein